MKYLYVVGLSGSDARHMTPLLTILIRVQRFSCFVQLSLRSISDDSNGLLAFFRADSIFIIRVTRE